MYLLGRVALLRGVALLGRISLLGRVTLLRRIAALRRITALDKGVSGVRPTVTSAPNLRRIRHFSLTRKQRRNVSGEGGCAR
jgi:hypothetical protein